MPVRWDSNFINTSKKGVFNYTGTIDGYDKKVYLDTEIIDETGDIYGNLASQGLITYYKENFYFSNPADSGKIYKMTSNAVRDGVKLCDDLATNINIVYDAIYYINTSDHNYVYKINLDGSGRVKLTDISAKKLLVNADKVYYSVDDYSGNSGIYKMNLDGTDKVKLSSEASYDMSIKDDYLYFTDHINYIYKMKLDGSGTVNLGNAQGGSMNVEKDWIYYINYSDYWTVYKIKTDGTGMMKVSDNRAQLINVYNGWIYYKDNAKQTLSKMRIDGTESMELSKKIADYIFAFGNEIFYMTNDPMKETYAVRLDGSKTVQLAVPYMYDKEPNNNLAQAQQYRPQYGFEMTPVAEGTLDKNDVDVYKLSPYNTDTFNVYISAPALGANVVVTLLDESGNVTYSAQTDSNGEAGVRTDGIHGTMYIKLMLKGGSTVDSGIYELMSWIGPW